MGEIVHATLRLYQQALSATLRSFVRCWIIAVAVVIFGCLMTLEKYTTSLNHFPKFTRLALKKPPVIRSPSSRK